MKLNISLKHSLFIFAMLILGPQGRLLLAQNAIVSGSLRGTISDSTKAVVAAAEVRVTNKGTGGQLVARTNGRGSYVFPALPVGRYSITIDKPGFNAVRIQDVRIEVGQATSEDVALRPGTESQTVEVTAAALLRQESSISSVVNQAILDAAPLSGRRYADFAQLTSNTSADGQTGLVSIGGEQGGEDTGYANGNGANSFSLDGAKYHQHLLW